MPARLVRMDGVETASSMTICRIGGTVLICAMHWARTLGTPSAARWSVAGRTRHEIQSRSSPDSPISARSRRCRSRS
ncbi:hypothetical protein AB0K12_30100 [Nonomuraea sp. NPDC049419]|uniref:hypothetical protein n=1 Tax=Nonomuraea sp. NPDC049419 TaxID=3155772 RepID=UPI00344436AD